MSADTLIERLDGVRRTGDGRWIARCPAHDDRTPSLSIRAADDRILIHCHAGCHAEDVITALGLTWRDLYRDGRRGGDSAGYAAAGAVAGRIIEAEHRRDPLRHERLILRIAREDLAAGRDLSIEDRARVELAAERLEVAHA